jgi:putative transposase
MLTPPFYQGAPWASGAPARQFWYDGAMLDGERYTKRCQRWNAAGHAHELTFTCYNNRPFLSKERTCRYLVDAISSARTKHEFDLWAYVFMPDHVHLIICPRQEQYSIAGILRSIKQPVSRRAIEYLRRNNPDGLRLLASGQQDEPHRFWQKGGGYDRNITRVDTLIEAIRYIHNNPVRKGLVDTADQWHYSSATDWHRPGSGPLSVDIDSFPR